MAKSKVKEILSANGSIQNLLTALSRANEGSNLRSEFLEVLLGHQAEAYFRDLAKVIASVAEIVPKERLFDFSATPEWPNCQILGGSSKVNKVKGIPGGVIDVHKISFLKVHDTISEKHRVKPEEVDSWRSCGHCFLTSRLGRALYLEQGQETLHYLKHLYGPKVHRLLFLGTTLKSEGHSSDEPLFVHLIFNEGEEKWIAGVVPLGGDSGFEVPLLLD